MTAPLLHHGSLRATLHGVERNGVAWQFRGLQYASIPYRFALPQQPHPLLGDVDCTGYGPRCPQNYIDFRHLLRIPIDENIPGQGEDEFACLNLDVTLPSPSTATRFKVNPLPVLIWIHGGSQAVTFGSSVSRLCDPLHLVERSIELGKPIIVVNVNYRLNAFAFGDETSEVNLALRDQRQAISYITQHIASFGGDPANITLAGESAGAVYTHAHLITNIPVRQCILQSGTLRLSPPQPRATAIAMIRKLSAEVSTLGDYTLRTAPVSKILEAQAMLGMHSYYLQMEDQLQDWQENSGNIDRVMIGDNQFEAALWRTGIQETASTILCRAFDLAGRDDHISRLKSAYGMVPDRPASCKLGALDFLNDMRFSLPTKLFTEQRQRAQKPVFAFLVDQPNPWQPSSGAHHGVDLLFLFGGFDLAFDESARRVSKTMQQKWIEFICGEDPWKPGGFFAFGPFGESKEVNAADRRRCRQIDIAMDAGLDNVEVIARTLAQAYLTLTTPITHPSA